MVVTVIAAFELAVVASGATVARSYQVVPPSGVPWILNVMVGVAPIAVTLNCTSTRFAPALPELLGVNVPVPVDAAAARSCVIAIVPPSKMKPGHKPGAEHLLAR